MLSKLHPLNELVLFCRGWARDLNGKRDPNQENINVAVADLAADLNAERIASEQRTVALINQAQLPGSPGGKLITVQEAAAIRDSVCSFSNQVKESAA